MTANYFILEILLNSHGRQAIQLRPSILQDLEKTKTLLKLNFIFIYEVILCT